MKWESIETAPKDRPILAYNPVVGIYNTQWSIDVDKEAPYYAGFVCGFWGRPGTWYCAPSHWMELPEPPA